MLDHAPQGGLQPGLQGLLVLHCPLKALGGFARRQTMDEALLAKYLLLLLLPRRRAECSVSTVTLFVCLFACLFEHRFVFICSMLTSFFLSLMFFFRRHPLQFFYCAKFSIYSLPRKILQKRLVVFTTGYGATTEEKHI